MAKKSVIEAGAALVMARRRAMRLGGDIERARRALRAMAADPGCAVEYRILGEAFGLLAEASKAEALIMQAHDAAAHACFASDENTPTNDEIHACLCDDPDVVANAGGR